MTSIRPAFLFALLAPVASADTLYVDANLATGANDGTTWANAFQGPDGLQAALSFAVVGDRVFVAQGTYRPTSTGAREDSFVPPSGVEIYGSFVGNETSPEERPPHLSAPSVLSGDLAGDDPSVSDNSYHVIDGAGAASTTLFDGFVITGGNADGPAPHDRGGALVCNAGAFPVFRDCLFEGNSAVLHGGAAYVESGSPRFLHCTFKDNTAGAFGGGLFALATSLRVSRCWFEGNGAQGGGGVCLFATGGVNLLDTVFWRNEAANSGGGAVRVGASVSTQIRGCTVVANRAVGSPGGGLLSDGGGGFPVANCILWDNENGSGAQPYASQVFGFGVTHCAVENGGTSSGNINTDPLFADVGQGRFDLLAGSPCIDSGSNHYTPTQSTHDRVGAPRVSDVIGVPNAGTTDLPVVDMGAYEVVGSIFLDSLCDAAPNSTMSPARLSASGSVVVAENDLTLTTIFLPEDQFGYFLMSRARDYSSVASGFLCLGAPQFRFSGHVLNTGAQGRVDFQPDFDNLPQGQVFVPGETWYFQLWYRDQASSNFSSNLGFIWL